MPYVVTQVTKRPKNPSLMDLFSNKLTVNTFYNLNDTIYNHTYFYKNIPFEMRYYALKYISDLTKWKERYEEVLDVLGSDKYDYEQQVKLQSKYKKLYKTDYNGQELNNIVNERTKQELNENGLEFMDLYYTFYRPKKKRDKYGNIRWRRIDAPSSLLSEAQRELANIFSTMMHGLTNHSSAYAYVKGRSILDANKKHQANGSRFSVQLDFSDFFGSTTIDFVIDMFSMIYPFSEVIKKAPDLFRDVLSIAFLNGKLPQGTPISPLITNIMMIPIDHRISNELINVYNAVSKNGVRHKFVYTRYADDIKISNRVDFRPRKIDGKVLSPVKSESGKVIDIESWIVKILKDFKAPFSLNKDKTKYTSIYGSNWSLGLLTNQYNEISLGHKSRNYLSAKLWAFTNNFINGDMPTISQAQKLHGELRYHMFIEHDKTMKIVNTIERKLDLKKGVIFDFFSQCM